MNFRLNAPNKFGEYLSASLPILVSVSGIMSELLLENDCGYEYKSSDELVDLINKYYESDELQKDMLKMLEDYLNNLLMRKKYTKILVSI